MSKYSEPKIGKCEYHLCGKQRPLRICKICGGRFCKEHIRPKIPSTFEIALREKSPISLEKFREIGHPCPEYKNHLESQLKVDTNKRLQALDDIKESRREFFKGHNKPTNNGRHFERGLSIDEILDGIYKPPRRRTTEYGNRQRGEADDTVRKKTPVKFLVAMTIFGLIAFYLFESPEKIYSILEIFKISNCTDGTFYNRCSGNRPYYCFNGTMIENSTACGCPIDEIPQGLGCVSRYTTQPKYVNLKYVIRGQKQSFDFQVYGGLNSYLSGISRTISYYEGEPEPTFEDFVYKNIDNAKQEEFLMQLIDKIRTFSSSADSQARIAISTIQNIPYDDGYLKDRYAYQVLFDNRGVCAEKSRLLVVLLRDLGYGTALIDYGGIETYSSGVMILSSGFSHEAVGIKCPIQYSYKNSGYCFIETTIPSIITDSEGEYPCGSFSPGCTMKLPDDYTITIISDGRSFDSVAIEYNDAKELNELNSISESSGGFLDSVSYSTWESLVNKYGLEPTQ